jgi:cytochrome c-type biogenesis protein
MTTLNLGLGLAFLAGLASFLSPCVLSLVPAYIGYLGGRSAGQSGQESRWTTLGHGLAFVICFSVVFIFLGIAASALGFLLYDARIWLTKIGGIVVVIFGVHMLDLEITVRDLVGPFRTRIPFLEYDTRVQSVPDRKWGYLSSSLMGVFFSAGWSPCVGPVLGAILTLSLSGGSVARGAALLTAYSAGLAIPFLLAALGVGWVTTILRRYSKVMRYIEIAMGVLLIIIGMMLFQGTFEQLARLGFFVDFGL